MVFLQVLMRNWTIATLLALITAAISACGSYRDANKSNNPAVKYKAALDLYKERKYAKALILFDWCLDYYRGKDSAEIVYYYVAYCHYGMGDYAEASLYFKDFNENFYNSKKTEECAYMEVYCAYLGAQSYELDQTSTMETIGRLQLFINLYPGSVYIPKCNEYIDNLRKRLHQKAFENTMQYFRMGEYRAALTMARNTIKDYPDIDQKEELEFIALKAAFLFADNSIESKKEERFLDAKEAYNEYRSANNAQAKHSAEAEELKVKIDKELFRIKSNK